MDKLNLCLSNLKSVKGGHVSKTRVEAVAAAAIHALRSRNAGEVAEALVLHAVSSSKEQRLAALYALHETVSAEKRKIEEKNSKQRTETRGDLSFALEARIKEVFGLFRDAPPKEREQVAKILQKWSERYVFPAELCRQCAQQADCAIPSPPAPIVPGQTVEPVKKKDDIAAISLMTASSSAVASQPVQIPLYKPGGDAPPSSASQPPYASATKSTGAPATTTSSKPSAWGSFAKRETDSRRDDSRREGDFRRDESRREGDSRRDSSRRRSRSRTRTQTTGGEKRSRWGSG